MQNIRDCLINHSKLFSDDKVYKIIETLSHCITIINKMLAGMISMISIQLQIISIILLSLIL
jgi:hypothetical protein